MIIYFLEFMIFIFIIFLIYQLAKFSLYLLYLWQIKEYRFDRFKQRLVYKSDVRELISYLNFLNFNNLKHPKVTLRTLLTFLLVMLLDYELLFLIYRPLTKVIFLKSNFVAILISSLLLIYYLNIFLVFLSTEFFSLALWPVKKFIIYLAKQKREKLTGLKVIGITGSFGKTLAKEAVAQVLALKYQVCKTPFNVNTEIGVARIILTKLTGKDQFFIVEMGAYKKGEIKAICDLVNPQVAILTGINQQHLALFGSQEKINQAKAELVKSLPLGGTAYFNAQNFNCRKLFRQKSRCQKILYGANCPDYHEIIDLSNKIAQIYQIPEKKLKRINKFLQQKIDLKKESGYKNCQIFDDSYNSNPDGFKKALKLISLNPRKKIVVTPGIIELGKESFSVHRNLGKLLAETADIVFLTNDNFYNYFMSGIKNSQKEKFIVLKKDNLKNWISQNLNRNWLVLFEGRVGLKVSKMFKK